MRNRTTCPDTSHPMRWASCYSSQDLPFGADGNDLPMWLFHRCTVLRSVGNVSKCMPLTHLLKKFESSIDWVLVALQTVASRTMLVDCEVCNARALTFWSPRDLCWRAAAARPLVLVHLQRSGPRGRQSRFILYVIIITAVLNILRTQINQPSQANIASHDRWL